MDEDEIPLAGGRFTEGVVRVGMTVRRPMSNSVAPALLTHLERRGFDATPRFIGTDGKGRAVLSYLDGEVPSDLGHYPDAVVACAGGLLRRFHDATADFAGDAAEVICHNDFGPPNAVFRDGLPAAMIDFDTLAPGTRLWDLGYSAFSWLDLGNDDYSGAEQLRRLEIFADGYAHAACPARAILVHAVARQVALAANAKTAGKAITAEWASAVAEWTVLNMLDPTGV